ncbi:NADH-quinone oxidoreductase subunit C [Streptomyces sp. PKU-EA00015]|uniref:NADH-quinone oxidoreductase subunit C n=1 Tax=Streptomyces sp. PKU-EA00015 TaxID=2748326 RepID=UPI0015A3E440|nr:NADH-quinone oxidoreductase subunit C [Streptomyces sp. PKU-EA00015]NWF26017.1 NADH-quinone oxidoreductase subunit C [Streptomyces sp. PKU-EA00015]
MNPYDSLPDAVTEIFGEEATAERGYDLLTVDVPAGTWIAALEIARDKLGCTYFDWLSAVDEPGIGFRVCAHVVSLEGRAVRRLLVRTTVPHSAPSLPTAVDVYAGASWHERETHEMFGVDFTGHPHLDPLLLPEGFEGHPLRKDFVLAARVAKAWPGAKEPGESEHGGPKRRQMLPPGVPDPNEWGPLKGQLPPAPARPARTPRAAAAPGATAERPPRRTRTASEGSASQAPAAPGDAGEARPARRTRTASEGSASQAAAAEAGAVGPARRTRSASEGSASQAPAAPGDAGEETPAGPRPRSSDAPWHHARPAFDDQQPPASAPGTAPEEARPPGEAPAATPEPAPPAEAEAECVPEPEPEPEPAPRAEPAHEPEADEPNRPAGGDPA